MGTHTRAQHHIGLRLMLTIALWGHTLQHHTELRQVEVDISSMGTHTTTSHWVEANVDNSSMGHSQSQHHIGLRR